MAAPTPTAGNEQRLGLVAGAAAFSVWGLAPIYWKQLAHVDGFETVAHRTVWSAVFMVLLFTIRGENHVLAQVWRSPQLLARLTLTACLIAFNWFLYIHAVSTGKILEASLGYFTNPILSVLLGMVFLGEVLSRRRRLAVLLAGAAVLLLGLHGGTMPWIALGLAISFGVYGLLRKTIPLGGAAGLAVEALLLAPFCLVYLGWREAQGLAAFGMEAPRDTLLLVLSGVLTSLPLWWFAEAARRLPLSTVGMLQYLAPSLQFLLAVLVYREPFDAVRFAAFALIWSACILFSWPQRSPPPLAPP